MKNLHHATDIISKIRDMDVQVYLDDFGTGYSSLNYIHKFPIHALKIDKSFIDNIIHDRESREIVKAISSLASNLGIQVIVEGVEDPGQLELFKEMDLAYTQGFLFSKPLAPQSVEPFLRNFSYPY